MERTRRKILFGGAATGLGAAIGLWPDTADAMSVQPMVIDLANGARTSSFQVQNLFQDPLPIELRVQGVRFTEAALEGDGVDSGDVVAFPPQTLIAPQRTQTCRVQYVGQPPTVTSKHYFVTVAQLPVQLPEGQSRIQVLYNFNVLVSVPLPGVNPNIHVVSTRQVTNDRNERFVEILFENASPNYGYLPDGRLRLAQSASNGHEGLRRVLESGELSQSVGVGMIGPRQRRRFTIRVTPPDPQTEVTAEFVNAQS